MWWTAWSRLRQWTPATPRRGFSNLLCTSSSSFSAVVKTHKILKPLQSLQSNDILQTKKNMKKLPKTLRSILLQAKPSVVADLVLPHIPLRSQYSWRGGHRKSAYFDLTAIKIARYIFGLIRFSLSGNINMSMASAACCLTIYLVAYCQGALVWFCK